MDLSELRAFLSVVSDGSFSRAAARLGRTQPAISQAIRRLETDLGQRLFDRSSNPGTLTEAGKVLRDYAERVVALADEAYSAVREIEQLHRGRVLIGTNDAGVPTLLPLLQQFLDMYPNILVDIRRVHARHIPIEVMHGNLDFGLMTFHPRNRRLREVALADDEMVVVVSPRHRFAKQAEVSFTEWAREPIIFHNDPSPARDRALRLAEEDNAPLNVRVAIPTLDGIKLAVEMGMGVSLLPRRYVMSELRRKQLVAVPMPELRLPRAVRLVYRHGKRLSHSAKAFLDIAITYARLEQAGGAPHPRSRRSAASVRNSAQQPPTGRSGSHPRRHPATRLEKAEDRT
jgi:DNA-binding transcriptional LysR family regulator